MSLFPILPESFWSSIDNDEVRAHLYNLQAKPDNEEEFILKTLRPHIPKFITNLQYIRYVIWTALITRVYEGEKLTLPIIDQEKFTKENALPYYLWGLLYDKWEPNQEEDGLSVFIQGYEKRGADNLRKRIYYSAITPDLYPSKYREKVVHFFDQLLDEKNAGKPLMRQYLDSYFDLYWNLHLGVTGKDIPVEVREIGESFNTVLAYLDPLNDTVYTKYMNVRKLRNKLTTWIKEKVQDVSKDRISDTDKTFVYYWLKNSDSGKDNNFRLKDITFECFHNFVALSQWGNTIYNIMSKLCKDTGDPNVRAWFKKTMESDYDQADSSLFTPLDRFVMELFRTISPNAGSVSIMNETRKPSYNRYGYILTPHKETSEYSIHWEDPEKFNPDRYLDAPTSDQIDEAKSKEIGFAQCPFHKETFKVKDGRKTELTNNAFGTVYGITDGEAFPVCDYAGYAPFGFGYRRCPGELFTIEVLKDFLRKVWNEQIEFTKLNITPEPEKVPVGPTAVVDDNIGFTKPNL